MPRITISSAAEKHLEAWLDQVMQGQLPLSELPLCVSAWFFAGESYAREELGREIENLRKQLDSAYLQAFAPKERRDEYQRRLDRYFAARDEAFFSEPEQLNTQQFELEPGRTPEIVSRNDGSSSATSGVRREAA